MYYWPPPDKPVEMIMGVFRDFQRALPLVAQRNWRASFLSWTCVPIGCLTVMGACAGMRALLSLAGTKLPETVLCLVILFLVLVLLSWVLPKKHMEKLVECISAPLGWTLRYINLFFTPSFVMLPRTAKPPSGAEVGKIIAIFIVGYFIMVPALAWFMRGMNKLIVVTRTSIHVRMHDKLTKEKVSLPTTSQPEELQDHSDVSTAQSLSDANGSSEKDDEKTTSSPASSFLTPSECDVALTVTEAPTEELVTTERHERMANWMCDNFDILTYLFIFIFVGIPVYYAASYTMPAYLTATTIVFLLAIRIPANPKKVLHPVIVTTCVTILVIWALAAIKDHRPGSTALIETLATYQTGNNYKYYFTRTTVPDLPLPGAGDILSSLLDVSIVAFALPMYKYRVELLRFIAPLTLGVSAFCIGELFIYPLLAYAVGIGADRALSFSPRSLSLPLAVLAEDNIGGDTELTAVLAIMSGMSGALVGLPLLRWSRIPLDDYVARGVSLGCNSSAIAAALLLDVDETAAALASLSMNMLGIEMIVLTLIPPITNLVRSLAGL